MGEKKITVELTESDARAYVKRTVEADVMERVNDAILAALPPEYPEGTVAWVTDEDHWRGLCEMRDGAWWIAGRVSLARSAAKVEPIRVLVEDEIAVKHHGGSPDIWREIAEQLRSHGFYNVADLAFRYADALEAEALS